MAKPTKTKSSKSGRKTNLSPRQLRYLFYTGFLTASGKGASRKLVTHPEKASSVLGSGSKLAAYLSGDKGAFKKSPEEAQASLKKLTKTTDNQTSASQTKLSKSAESPQEARSKQLPPYEAVKPAEIDAMYGREMREYRELSQKLGDPIRNVSESQREGFSEYVSSSYSTINNSLRGTLDAQQQADMDSDGRRIRDTINEVQSAIDQHGVVLPQTSVLYRGIGGELSDNLRKLHEQGQLAGTEVLDKGFMSTTTAKTVAEGFSKGAMIRIVPGTKTKAMIVQGEEAEVLFGTGTRIRFAASQVMPDGKLVVDAHIVD